MIDLTTRYLGLELRTPLVASASPVTGTLASLKRLEEAGVAAVVLPSLFEEQITHEELHTDRIMETGAECFAEALSYFPELEDYNTGPEEYLGLVEDAKANLSIPVIASINGVSDGWWVRYARSLEEAGADAIELNVYYVAADATQSGGDVERQYLDLIGAVRTSIGIPLAVKVSPFFSSFGHMARRMVQAGADGLVLFNRFYQPDLDLESFAVTRHLALSTSHELRLPLRWIGVLHGRVDAYLAATTGIHNADDAVRVLMVGADVAMMASALLRHGPGHVAKVEADLREWMLVHEYGSVSELRGCMSQRSTPDPAAFERANYMKTIAGYTNRLRH
jgi:dihydroorotate dehydrogenase (fumarate)